jgi:hypothetical protein
MRDDQDTPVELACKHMRGGSDDDYPECRRCNTLMEKEENGESTAFCANCAYEVLDVLAREIVRQDDAPELFRIQSRVAALEAELTESQKAKMILTFISEMALTVSQSAIGPLNETQSKMISEIKQAARGTVPDWFLKDWEDRSK